MEALQWLKNRIPAKRNARYLIRGGFSMAAEQALTMAMGIAFGVVLVRTLPQADYGTYKFFFSLLAVFQIFLFNGMNAAVLQATGRGDTGALATAVRFRLRWMPLFSIIVGSVAFYYALRLEYGLSFSFFVIAGLYPVIVALNTYQSYLQGLKKFGLVSFSSVATQCFVTGAMCVALILTKSLVIIVTTYAITNLLCTLFFFLIFKPPQTDPDRTGVVRYGKHLTYIDSIGTISQQLDQLLLFYIWGPAILAHYAIAQMFPAFIYNFLKSLSTLLTPLFAAKKIGEIVKNFYAWLLSVFILGISISAAYIAFAPTLFKWFFPQYGFLVGYTQLIALDLIWALPAGFIGSIFTAHKFLRASYGIPIAGNIVRITLYSSLGVAYGLQGMIIAYLISRTIGMGINIGFWEYERRRANS